MRKLTSIIAFTSFIGMLIGVVMACILGDAFPDLQPAGGILFFTGLIVSLVATHLMTSAT